ncbi:MAG: ABC transporter permease [Acidobacteriota bacterium]|nr:ABC transporter permease [Acidobacteriota bacterium]
MQFWRPWSRRRTREAELDLELRDHIELEAEEQREAGASPEEATYAARRALGNTTQIKEDVRMAWGFHWLETLLQDLRYGLRQLRRNPGFTAVAVITVALGIGANTAIFSVVNAVLLRPLPYPDSRRIVNIFQGQGADTLPMFTYLEQSDPGFQELAAYGFQAYAAINLNGGNSPVTVEARKVSANYFGLFGANLIMGRTFTAEEDRPDGPHVAVMSYGLWQHQFSSDPATLGKTITLGGAPYTVIGVFSPSFRPYPATEIWVPLQANPNSTNEAHTLMIAGRLPPGVTLAQANSWATLIGKRYVQSRGDEFPLDAKLQVVPMQRMMTSGIRPTLLILMGTVGLVLLIACVNIANLLLARGAGRQREIAVRRAVGASRGRIIRQVLTESLLLALAGGALGFIVGDWGVRALLALAPPNAYSPTGKLLTIGGVPSISALDPRVAGIAFLLTVVTGLLFGLFPALRLSLTDLTTSLKESSGGSGISADLRRTRNGLVAAEVAIGFILLCGAILLIRSLAALSNQKLGFDPHNVLTMAVSLAGPRYSKSGDVNRLAEEVVSRIQRIPGVQSAAMASALPLWGGTDMLFRIPGTRPAKGQTFTGDVDWRIVSPQYFQALGIPLVSGRLLREEESERTVVINQAMAHKFWPNSNPVGQSIVIGAGLSPKYEEGLAEIVGIVGNVRVWTLYQSFAPTMYQLPSHIPDAAMALVSRQWPDAFIVRTSAGVAPGTVSRAVQQILLKDVGLAPTHIRTMGQVIQDSTSNRKFTLLLMELFAAAALLLAAIGLYGVISYAATERTHEIGIRMALGAQKRDVLRLAVGQGMILALAGVGIGIAGALGLMRFLSSMLFGVKPTDPLTFIAVSLILIVVALLACYIPARRAANVDPMVALRHE